MKKKITSNIIIAYSQCHRKGYLLLFTDEKASLHEYIQIIQNKKMANQKEYINGLKQNNSNVHSYDTNSLKCGRLYITNATLKAKGLEADCDILTKVKRISALDKYSYEPTIVVGTYSVNKEQKLELFFVGYVLGLVQKKLPKVGKIVAMDKKIHKIKIENGINTIITFIKLLQEWIINPSPEPPPLILNKHCLICQFRRLCTVEAEQEDNISMLAGVTPKVIQKYKKKGIFTIKQLSYLYKPRKKKKRAKIAPMIRNFELQALALREGVTYLKEMPELTRHPIELFLDIEGIPDQRLYYLIGLLIKGANKCECYYFWADTPEDELSIWRQFLEKSNQYPDAPIYHYGNYEPKAIDKLGKRYVTNTESLNSQLVNLNTYIYGKVYFPVRSNTLKEIGDFIGASWTSPDASGLQSLVWRERWDETRDPFYKKLLITYNNEDCKNLKLLTDELSKIQNHADSMKNIDFADQPKITLSEKGSYLHNQFKTLLKFAHADYDIKKICLRQNNRKENNSKTKRGAKFGHQGYQRIIPKARKIIRVPRGRICPRHKGQPFNSTENSAERTIIDLKVTKNGIRKTITKYEGKKGYCPKCKIEYNPPSIRKFQHQFFGHGFRAWTIYMRVALRLPYSAILQLMGDLFNERVSPSTLVSFMAYFANYYSITEKTLRQRLLASPFIHVDETKINIQGADQYVWVFTNRSYVIFKITPSRETKIVHKILHGYRGILISDFYGGYDSLKCRQQKCWVHLIRDLNNDLWKNPFDWEFEVFVSEIANLILPIFESVERYGLKRRNLNKFRKNVTLFYKKSIINRIYKSELTIKYQKRFNRYKESLFVFLENDEIPWNNNTAERALRHLAIQRKISGTFFESVVQHYLLLLGITQSCRFQNKSLLEFLLSGEKDIDNFRRSRQIRISQTT